MQGLEAKSIFQMFVPGSNGIPEWISHQKNGFKMTMELPCSWYENDDFLGFVLSSLYGPLDKTIKRAKHRNFFCNLNLYDDRAHVLRNDIWIDCFNHYSYYKDESNRVWLIYYSKSNIPKRFHSNGQKAMEASFAVYFGSDRVKADRCGFHFLYAHDYEHYNPTMEQGSSSLGDLGRHRSVDGVDHSTTQDIDGNGVDAQDHEMDHIHRWLELLCKFAHWIYMLYKRLIISSKRIVDFGKSPNSFSLLSFHHICLCDFKGLKFLLFYSKKKKKKLHGLVLGLF